MNVVFIIAGAGPSNAYFVEPSGGYVFVYAFCFRAMGGGLLVIVFMELLGEGGHSTGFGTYDACYSRFFSSRFC